MTTLTKKKKIIDYVYKADPDFLEIIYQLIKYNESANSDKSLLSNAQKTELDKTIIEHENGKLTYYTFDEIKKSIARKKAK